MLTLFFTCAIIMLSCKKKEPTASNVGGQITATINGTNFTSVYTSEITFSGTPYNQYAFSGESADSSQLILYLSPVTVGTQTFGTAINSPGMEYLKHGGEAYFSTNQSYTTVSPGSMDITSASGNASTGTVSGTFSATLYPQSQAYTDSVVITNGVFTNCKY